MGRQTEEGGGSSRPGALPVKAWPLDRSSKMYSHGSDG